MKMKIWELHSTQIRSSLAGRLVMLFLLFVLVDSANAQPSGYLFYKPITISGAQVQGTHTDFPVLIQLTDSDLANFARSDGFDIVFTTSPTSTTTLDHQLESFNSGTGELIAWVKLPTLPDAGTTIYMFYGNSSASINPTTTSTWSNQFRTVYHLGSTFNDATANNNDGTNSGTTAATGKIGSARNFDGNADYIAINDNYASTTEAEITVSAWIKTSQGGDQIIASFDRNEYWRLEINGNGGGNGQVGWDILTSGGQIDFGSSATVDNDTWRYVTGVYDNGAVEIYIDGILNTNTTQGTTFGTGNTRFGFVGVGSEAATFDGNQGPSNNFNGEIDEFRISNVARSANWIQTEFNNQNAPLTFYSVGAQVSVDQTAPLLESAIASTDSLVLDYDENLDGSSVPSTADFTVNIGGLPVTISNVVVSSDSVLLILQNPISPSDVITVSYTAGSNPVRDISLNNVANLTNSPVTNSDAAGIPAPPVQISAAAVNNGIIELTFNDVDGTPSITDYNIYRSTTSGSGHTQIGTISDNESTDYTFIDNTTADGTTYYYFVRSENSNNVESIDSEEVSATSDATAPTLNLISGNAGVVTIDYDELLNPNSIPSTTAFIVYINSNPVTVTNVDVSGPRVILEISPDLVAGDVIGVDYVDFSGPIRDLAQNQAANFGIPSGNNNTPGSGTFGPDPCPIVNNHDVAWACFDGVFNSTSMTANVGGLDIATVSAATGSSTTFAPNALQQWSAGDFNGDQFNGPQANPVGTTGDATSLDIAIPAAIPSDALILSLNRLRPIAGAGTSYTLEAYDGANNLLTIDDWITGQGLDGGICTNNVVLNYTNGNTRIEFQPGISGNPSCASSSTPIWFRITDDNVERIELRKVATDADNIHIGLGVVADFGDAPNTYGTLYAGNGTPPAFHLLNNSAPNLVYLGAGVDGDGNGAPGANNNGDDIESSGIGNGDDEDGISLLADINTSQSTYQTTLVCTNGNYVSGWIDFDQSGTFDPNEFANTICNSGSATLNWTGISGLVTGTTSARFRIASNQGQISNPIGFAYDGEVEDYSINIIPPPLPNLEIAKTVNNSNPTIGETITYTLTVTNPGDFNATGIRVTDQLPSGVTFVSSSASQGSYNAPSGIWNIGTILDGDTTSVTLSIDATVNTGTLGNTIVNNASITALNETDPELNNNSASAGITVVPESADIGISKIVDDNTPLEGQAITFTVIVTNNGPKNATNLEVIDQIPAGLNYVSSSASIGSYNNSTGIWDIGTLNNGAQATLVINANVAPNTEGSTITNTANLNSMDQIDPVTSNNTGSVQVNVVTPGFPQSCNVLPSPVFEGNTLTAGTAGQVGAIHLFEDILTGVDAEIEVIAINNAYINVFDASVSGDFDNFQPEIGVLDENLPIGYIDFEIRFLQANTQNPQYLTFAASGIDIDGNGLREFVGFQQLTSFTVEQATNLIVDNLGIYTTFEAPGNTEAPGVDTTVTENLVYTTYTNEPKFRYRAGIKNPTNTTRRQFSLGFSPCIINGFTNPTQTNIVDLGITKEVNDNTPNEGDNVTFTIEVTNLQGNSVGSVEVTDQLPGDLTFVSATPTLGTFNETSGNIVWDVGTLAGAQSATLTVVASVDNNTAGNSLTNTATITDFTGTDGNVSNNSAFVNMVVNDPQSTSCTEPPTFNFFNNTLEQGVPNQVNAIYRFTNVASGVDALVKVVAINNATLDNIDDNAIANADANFSPLFTALQGGGFIDWEITFVNAGTLTPTKKDFALTGLDIDGFVYGDGTVQDYLGFSQNQGYIVQAGNNLLETTAGNFQIFQSSTTTDGNGSFDIDHMAYILYNYTSVFRIRTGTVTTGTTVDDRLVDIDFTPCRNQDFTNPVQVNRNADIAVTKTVDEPNPLENGTVNFTITATNNGPERVTELDINETLPTGLTLVQANPSQGAYSQITNIWAVGELLNGASATLQIEATVNSGIQQDSLINKVFVQGLNQVDPNITNDTSQVVLKIGVELKGIVFQDITGNGFSEDLSFNDAAGDQQALENVEVHLFKDGGDQTPDGSDDVFVETVLTNNLGEYTFNIGEDADYWVVVDSKTGELSDGNFWGEQTYGPIGGYCEDGTGNVVIITAAGQCFGGRRGDISDNISSTPVSGDLVNAEHIAEVTIAGSGVVDVNFGFSFNVVTNTDDGDDDGSANRSIQGSLRQFITNANEITGANSMRFVPSVPTNSSGGGGNWWTTTLTSELPPIVDALTTISGIAYLNSAPKTTRNDNPGLIGIGGTVGVDNLTGSTTNKPEFEINLGDVGSNALLVNSTGAYTIRNIALFNNSTGIRVQAGNNGLLEKNLVGARADGTDPTASNRLDIGIDFNGATSVNPLIQESFIAFTNGSGIKSINQQSVINVFKNEIYRTGQSSNDANGIEGIGSWTIQQNRIHENGNGSSSTINGGNGIQIGSQTGTSSNNTIRNNSIYNNNVTGVSTLNGVSSTVIDFNIIYQNGTNYISGSPKLGAGVKLASPSNAPQQGVRIGRNSFYDNYGISIDHVTGGTGEADGVSPNDGALVAATQTPNRGIDYPVFTLSTLENGVLYVEGYVGTTTTKLTGTFTIQVYKADNDGDSDGLVEVGGTLVRAHGEGRDLIGVITTNPNGQFSANIPVPGNVSLAFNDRITAIAISSVNNTSEFGANSRVIPTGVTVSGTVYHDLNHNQIKDGGEPGLPNVTITLYNTQENNCKSVLTDANGLYVFNNVLNGTYDLIESFGQSVPTPDVCTPAENDPVDYISTTPNLRTVTVNNLPAIQDFGDFEGSKITGTVFNDDGASSGTANDGIQNGGEVGISTQLVQAFDGNDVLIEQTTSAADGSYALFVPKSVVGTGGTVKIVETNGSVYLSTGGDAGTTAGTYTIATDATVFTNTVGIEYQDVDFADVAVSILLTDGSQTTQPGAVATFTHLFTAKTAGTVTFTTSSVNTPNINYPTVLSNDLNCDGDADSGEPILTPLTTLNVTSGQDICLVLRVTVPNGVNDGATSTTTVTATFDYSNSPTNIQQVLTRTDIISVSTADGGFVIVKAVDKAQALPGDTLMYSITYENLGDEPISQVEVIDEVPVFTTYQSSQCGTLPAGFTNCSITTPTIGTRGTIKWTFTGVLQPGETGTVSYKVLIDN